MASKKILRVLDYETDLINSTRSYDVLRLAVFTGFILFLIEKSLAGINCLLACFTVKKRTLWNLKKKLSEC